MFSVINWWIHQEVLLGSSRRSLVWCLFMKIFLFVDNNPGTVGGTTFNSDKKHFRVLLCLKKYQMWFFDRKYKIIDFEKTSRFLRFLNKFTSHCVHLFKKCAPQSGITTSFKTLAILFKFLITRTWRHVPLDAYSIKNDFTYEFHGVNRSFKR